MTHPGTNRHSTPIYVSPEQVHRTNRSETFVETARTHVDAARDAIGIRGTVRPRTGHRYYGHTDRYGTVGCLYGLEALRQAETLFAHEWLGQPRDAKFVWRSLSMHVVPDADSSSELASLSDNTFELLQVPTAGRNHHYRGAVRVDRAGVVLDDLTVTYVDADTYKVMRGGNTCRSSEAPFHESVKPPPDSVGRADRRDVAIGAAADGTYRVGADFDSPTFFEHPQDHWPGMVLVDAATQLSTRVAPPDGRLTGVGCTFSRYGELTSPVTMSLERPAETSGVDVRTVDLEQGGRVATRVVLEFS